MTPPPLESETEAAEPQTYFVSGRSSNKTMFLWFDEPVSAEMSLSEGSHSAERCTTHVQFTDPSTSH